MQTSLQETLKESASASLARSFARLGRIGLWTQLALGAIPVALLAYTRLLDRGGGGTRGNLPLIGYLTLGGLVVLAFTAFWFFRYTRLAKRIADPERRPAIDLVQRTAWIGVAASTLGIAFSAIVAVLEVTLLFTYFLRAPQVGVPVVQTTAAGSATWVSAADVAGLLVLLLTMCAEIVVLAFSLWLLLRSLLGSVEYSRAEV
jgi:Protein of unknown function (DUF3611)